jgi:hypothetical protein
MRRRISSMGSSSMVSIGGFFAVDVQRDHFCADRSRLPRGWQFHAPARIATAHMGDARRHRGAIQCSGPLRGGRCWLRYRDCLRAMRAARLDGFTRLGSRRILPHDQQQARAEVRQQDRDGGRWLRQPAMLSISFSRTKASRTSSPRCANREPCRSGKCREMCRTITASTC